MRRKAGERGEATVASVRTQGLVLIAHARATRRMSMRTGLSSGLCGARRFNRRGAAARNVQRDNRDRSLWKINRRCRRRP
jgi:hypothetical protein